MTSTRVPNGWQSVELVEVARECRQRNTDGSLSSDTLLGVFKNEGMVPMRDRVRGSDVSRCKVLPAGAFAYNPMRLNIGSIARWAGDADAIVSPDYVVFQCDERQLSGDFLDYVRQSKDWATYMENAGKGGVRIRIYFKELGQFRFLLPPLPEQRRIAEILSSVDEAIAATQAVIEQTRTVKQGVLKRLLTKGIGHTRFKQTEIGEIPEAWEVVPLQAIASVQTGLAKGSNKPDDPVELPYLRVANVQDGYIDLTEVKSTAVDRSRVARYSLRAGDVLLTEGGDFDKLGRGAVWRAQVEPCLHQNHVFAVRPNQEVLLSDFLAAQTASDHGRRYFLSCAKQTTNLASINSTQLKEFPAIVPPLKEQSAINARTAALQEAEDVAKASLRRLEQIKSALMSDLLTGRKRVPMAELAAAE